MIHERIICASGAAYDATVHDRQYADNAREVILALQAAHGYRSTRALAAAAGIPQPTLSRFLKGTSQTMEVDSFQALSRLFGVTLSELLGEVPLGSSVPAREVTRLFADMTPTQQEQLLRIAQALKGPPER